VKALVVNCSRNGLAVIRGLASRGVEVIAVDHDLESAGLYSRLATHRRMVPRPVRDPDGFIDGLEQIAEQLGGGDKICLVPTNDVYLTTLGQHWDRLRGLYHPAFETDASILRSCVEKNRMYRVAQDADVPYPRSVTDPPDAAAVSHLRYPLIVKPSNRNTPENIRAGIFRIRQCATPDEVTDAITFLHAAGTEFVVQEYIPGDDSELFTAGIVGHRGNLLASFTGRKLRQFPIHVGECAFGEAVREPRITEYARRLVEATGFTGIAQVEFKRHAGEFYLMEMNPRSWSWIGLAVDCGVNLPWIACCSVAGIDLPPKDVQQTDFSATWQYMEVDFLHSVLTNHSVSLPKFVRDTFHARSRAHFRMDDPVPGLVSLASFTVDQTPGLRKTVESVVRRAKALRGDTGG
jgi:predicted ATP-grasp superfamily ATP-dependent carboligase